MIDDGRAVALPSSTPGERWLLATAMACAPLTTSPLLPGSSQVRPLAAVPCALLLLLAIRHLGAVCQHRPRADLGLLALFAAWAVGAGGIAAWAGDAQPFRGATPGALWLRAAFTLAVGVGTYAAVRLSCRDPQAGRWAIRGLYIGGIATCVLALAQAAHALLPHALSELVWATTRALADTPWSDPATWTGRAIGPTLEPSWLASYLTVLLLPVALARVAGGIRMAAPWRSWAGDAGMVLLVVTSLVAACSRAGLAATLLIGAVAGLMMAPRRLRVPMAAAGLLAAIMALAIAAQRIPDIKEDLSAVADAWAGRVPVSQTMVRLGADERVAGWMSGWNMALSHPCGGVGLGQAPLAYRTQVPGWARDLPGVQRNLADLPGASPPNPKSMPARIAGELGLIGLGLWAGFVAVALLARQASPGGNALCLAGLAGLAVDWLSLDSFALATVWFLLALCATSVRTGIADPPCASPSSPSR